MEREPWMDDVDKAVACCGKEAVLAKLEQMLAAHYKRERLEKAGYPPNAKPGTSMYGVRERRPRYPRSRS